MFLEIVPIFVDRYFAQRRADMREFTARTHILDLAHICVTITKRYPKKSVNTNIGTIP